MKSAKSWLKSPLSNLKSKQYETETERLERLKREVLAEGKAPTRRSFIARLGMGATLVALAAQAYAFLRSLKPNVLYEAPQRFKVGLPDQFGEGAKFLDDKRLFIFRQGKTFYSPLRKVEIR